MYVVAITGSIGTGKSSALRYFKSLGYPCISADDIVHHLYQCDHKLQKDIEQLAQVLLIKKEGIDRQKLGKLFFSNETFKKEVEQIVHQRVFEEIELWKEIHSEKDLGFIEIPLLFETNSQHQYDTTLMIASDPKVQWRRLRYMRKMTVKEIKKRLASQLPQDEKIKLADTVIYNNSTKNKLEKLLDQYLQEVTRDLRKNEGLS